VFLDGDHRSIREFDSQLEDDMEVYGVVKHKIENLKNHILEHWVSKIYSQPSWIRTQRVLREKVSR
jgi:hypothetical protein